MTIAEFNEQYRIEVSVRAIQAAKLFKGNEGVQFGYGDVESLEENIQHAVYCRKTDTLAYVLETRDIADDTVIDLIKEKFNIK